MVCVMCVVVSTNSFDYLIVALLAADLASRIFRILKNFIYKSLHNLFVVLSGWTACMVFCIITVVKSA